MFLLFKRINIFLLSFFIVASPTINYAYAIDPMVPPFTSSAAAGDIAAALGAGETGGFAAGAATAGAVAAAIGVGVGSFCIASAVQGMNMCGVSTPICQALTAAWISCNPNPDGSFNKMPPASDPTKPSDSHKYLYSLEPIVWKHIGEIQDDLIAQVNINPAWTIQSITFVPSTEPYTGARIKEVRTADGYTYIEQSGVHWMADSSPPPDEPPIEKADPGDVGKAVAGNPAAAAAVGAAAASAAGVGTGAGSGANTSNCSGTVGTFNGVSKCVPAFGASKNPSCNGYSGVFNGKVACAHAAGDSNSGSCSGMFVTVNGVNQCITDAGTANPACSAKLAVVSDSFICIGSDETPSYDASRAGREAASAANAASANPPSSRTCKATMKLNASGICINPALPDPRNKSCKQGYVWSVDTCVPADPLNPSMPASPTNTGTSTGTKTTTVTSTDAATGVKTTTVTTTNTATGEVTGVRTTVTATDAATGAKTTTVTSVPTTATGTSTAAGASSPTLTFPAFCGWAAIVCDVITWAKTDAKAPTDTAVTIKNDTPTDLQNFDLHKSYFNFGSQCPSDVPMSFSILGKSTTLNFKYTAICDFLGKIRPFVIGSAWIAGAFIISGASRKGGED